MDTGTNAGTMVCLPPAPNWYKPLATGGSGSGFYCYASKHNVVVLDARNGAPTLRECLVVAAPGTEIVTSVMFCRSERADPDEVPALLTVTSDGVVQVWDVKTRAVKHTVSSQSSACCADWRGTLSTSVVFNGRGSTLLKWNLVTGAVAPAGCRSQEKEITILRCHPTDPDVAAVGYYNGTIVVQGLKNGSNVLYKLKGHSLMVLSLSWDVGVTPGEDSSPQPLRLCSTAFDRTLKIWDVAGEKLLTSLKVPLSKKGKGVDVRDKWIAACWIPGGLEKIVASSIAGDVCVYDPSAAAEWSFLDCDADSGGHTASVYNVCIVGDAEKGTKMYVVSASEDRNIVFWDLATKKSAYCIPCAGGFIYSLAFSPFAYATLAVGSGDGSVKVWRTDCLTNPYSAKVLTVGKKDRVRTVAWHPRKEAILALGTEEGKVCVADVNTRQVTVSKTFHKDTTYAVCWADLVLGEGAPPETCLLSCDSSRVKIHRLSRLDKEAADIESILFSSSQKRTPSKRVCVAFNQDLGILTLSLADGTVELFKSYGGQLLKKAALLEVQRKPADCLAWHPAKAPFSDCNSHFKYWLAFSSTDGKISVFDLSRLEKPNPNVHRILQPTVQFSGQSSKVVSLAWSPFRENLLASASFDQTVQVWDVDKAQLVATYQGHTRRLFSVCWSPVDSDILFSGGEDNIVRCWKLSEQPVKPQKVLRAKVNDENGSVAKANCQVNNGTEVCVNGDNATSAGMVAVEATQSQSSVSTVPAKPPSKASSVSGSKKKSKTVKSYFPCFSQFENLPKENRSDDARYLADVLAKCNGGSTELDSAHSHLGMYTDAPGALTVLEKEIRHHKQEHNLDYAFQMMAWKGDLATALREAAAERRLTDSLVAQAPSLSRSVWFEMCERYAAQLSSEGEHHRAVLYYLACHKVELAVNLLCENSLYREALAIARAHLPEDDPQIERIYASWAERASGVGNFEQAAKCYLAIGDAAKAVSSLMNRRDPHSLRSAAYIAKKSGLLAEMETTFQAALQASLTNNEWDQTVCFVEEQERSRAFVTFIQLHKALIEAVDEVSREKIENVDAEDSTCRVLWSSRRNTAATFLSSVVRAYESNGYQPLASTLGFTELSELLGFGDRATRTVLLHDTKENVLFHVAGCLAVSLFSPDLWTLYLARALSAAYAYNRELFVNLCMLLFRGKVTDSTFTGEVHVDINPSCCLLFDEIDRAADLRAKCFNCPQLCQSHWSNFSKLITDTNTPADPAREVVLTYLCDALLDVCDRLDSTSACSSFAQGVSSLLLSPTIACFEHMTHRLAAAEKNLFLWRSELQMKKSSTAKAEETKDELSKSVLEEEVELCKACLQEFHMVAPDCVFPKQLQLLARLKHFLDKVDDRSCTELKTRLEAWIRLISDV
uniref:Putative wd40 domain protein n=1 Tax=Hyalomma excavatum TaxID=257692 RepID=A0A131XK29_9ACAR